MYPDITWKPTACLDRMGTRANSTIYFLPTEDRWLLAVLNSSVGWWYSFRTAQHGKDEALRFFTTFVEAFPIPAELDAYKTELSDSVANLIRCSESEHQMRRDLFDWLRV